MTVEGYRGDMAGNESEVAELAIEAGRLLLENGAEIYRVEETMDRICHHYGVASANAFVLSNGIFVTLGDKKEPVYAKVQHIPVVKTYLGKVAAVNQLSREIEDNRYSVEEAQRILTEIRGMPEKRSLMQVLASGLGSGAFCYLFGGNLMDAAAAGLAGVILYLYVLGISERYLSRIVGIIGGGALVTAVCAVLYVSGMGQHLNFMIIGSIMPLVPGVAFVNAIKDIANGDYISGSVRMLDALLIFFSIAIGVGMSYAVLARLIGGILL